MKSKRLQKAMILSACAAATVLCVSLVTVLGMPGESPASSLAVSAADPASTDEALQKPEKPENKFVPLDLTTPITYEYPPFDPNVPIIPGLNYVVRDEETNLCGIKNKDGEWLCPPQFEYLSSNSSGTYLAYVDEDTDILVNCYGQQISPFLFERGSSQIYSFSGDRAIIIEPEEGDHYSRVIIDNTGKPVFQLKQDCHSDPYFINGAFSVYDPVSGCDQYIDKDGNPILGAFVWKFPDIIPSSDLEDNGKGEFLYTENGKVGIIKKNGEWVLPPQYDELTHFSDGYALAKQGDRVGCINEAGEFTISWNSWEILNISELKCGYFGVLLSSQDSAWRIYRCTGEEVQLKNQPFGSLFNYPIGICKFGIVAQDESQLWGLMDFEGNWVIQPQYVQSFDLDGNDLFEVQATGSKWTSEYQIWYIIDPTGKVLFRTH